MDAQGLIQALKGFATGGLQGAGMPLPPAIASNPVQHALQNPDNQAALGIARIPLSAERLLSMRNAGMTNDQMARQLGVSKGTVANRVKELNLEPRRQAIDWPKVDELKQQGLGTKEIAEQLGVDADNLTNAGYVRASRARSPNSPAAPAPGAQPSMPQTRFQQQAAPAEDPEMAAMMTNYLRSIGAIE